MSPSTPLITPDGRYLVVRGRLWRCTNPALPEPERQGWVQRLMRARRGVAQAKRDRDAQAEREARDQVDEAKRALGERGPVWWEDGAPDYTRCKVENTPYADWYAGLRRETRPSHRRSVRRQGR